MIDRTSSAVEKFETPPSFERAVDTLSKLQERVGSAGLAYLITPNVILTLAGARAFCDGVFYSNDDKDLQQISEQVAKVIEDLKVTRDLRIAEHGIEVGANDRKFARFSVIVTDGLYNSLSETRLLGENAIEIADQRLQGEELMDAMLARLKQNEKLQDISEENLTHIAFGILVGYPDKALVGSANKWDEDPSEADDPLVDARLEAANYYDCPQPVYSYPRSMADDPEIIAHEQKWSKILTDFYESDFHGQLAQDPAFRAKAKELCLYN